MRCWERPLRTNRPELGRGFSRASILMVGGSGFWLLWCRSGGCMSSQRSRREAFGRSRTSRRPWTIEADGAVDVACVDCRWGLSGLPLLSNFGTCYLWRLSWHISTPVPVTGGKRGSFTVCSGSGGINVVAWEPVPQQTTVTAPVERLVCASQSTASPFGTSSPALPRTGDTGRGWRLGVESLAWMGI
ncbi:hypothetical protein BU16DRAFT_582075 [Lophium mytilinum]|uniref:Uncharacterized protein n=1 Tax=Lophium mytilinum TaxID=390894 RepID=A0A6A6QTT7_9PEZI|nr:hypothetical protein BU16DRAFT_582075 [Lophium mytilinum]